MKTSCLIIALLTSIMAGAQTVGAGTQTTTSSPALPPSTAFSVVSRDANSAVWERTVYTPGPNGTAVPVKHRYTAIASGLNFRDPATGQWTPSREEIETYPRGAIARHGQYQVIFANNLNSAGAIDLQAADGQRLRSNIIGLAYYDSSSGQSVLIAQIQDSQGELISSNQVLYPNAFEGVKADVRYTYKRGSFEQDVILREQPPLPESLGLASKSTEIEVLTEFIDPPQASVAEDAVENDSLPDEDIGWGATRLGHGKAFDLGEPRNRHSRVNVRRQYISAQGRNILVEGVPINQIQPDLASLPLQSSTGMKLPMLASKTQALPKAPPIQAEPKPMKLASASPAGQGFVLDYVQLNTDTNNFTFQADTTYYVANSINFSGTVVIEGGTVIKYNTDPNNPTVIQFWGAVHCDTGPYRPAIFTSRNDDTVGESVSQPGTPMNYWEPIAGNAASSTQWKYLHIRYANYGIQGNGRLSVSDSQFMNCGYAFFVYWGPCYLTNDLLVNVGSAFYGNRFAATAYQLTVDGCTNNQLVVDFWGQNASTVSFISSLLVNVGANGAATVTTDHTARVTDGGGQVFQTVGAGSCYLPTNSPYHNAGTPNLDPSILADIATKTTYPPIVYSNTTISAATTFSPQAQRDTNSSPDLGYHYDPLDYFFGGVVAQSNVTFTAGTAVGWFELPGSGGPGYGMALKNDVVATFNGTATSPCIFARYDTVQEGGNGLWKDKGWLGGMEDGGSYDQNNPAGITATFTHFYHLAGDPNHFRDGTSGQPIVIQAEHCEIYGSAGGYNILAGYTNCLFYRAGWGIGTASAYPYQIYINCTFYGGSLGFGHGEGGAPYWYSYIHDCAFDNTTFSIDDPFGNNTNYADYNYNAFDSGAAQPPTEGGNTVVVTGGFNWQSSWFGNFYQATNSPLIDEGDRTADQLGLYHFTMQTNQVPETNSIVDIGYHYVATDQYGNPLDSNGNGIPDYLEDTNGNGQAMTIVLIAPTNNAYFKEPATIPLQASVFDWRSVVTNVTFYQGTIGITGVTNAPYNYTWPVVAAGQYTLMATARDMVNGSATSAAVSVTVTNLCSQ